ncbi:hypothetical protein ACFYWX_04285 [Streptomyces sp. NPDC002888]|uniref:hypothetical protein n=1 Tax=Streptomyces sp. NPDC002888 TaxID=3364668 RepID=UPI0036CC7145
MNQEPLPNELIDAARKLRKDDARRLTPAEGVAIAQQLKAQAKAAEKGLTEYLVGFVHEELGPHVATPDPDIRSAFWSHVLQNHPYLEENERLSNQHVAGAYTDAENAVADGSTRFLEGTRGGKELSALHLWDKAVHDALELDEKEGNALAGQAWSALSQEYAKATQGEAVLFARGLAPWSVAYQTELPELRTGTGLDNIHFMYPPSEADLEGLPPQTRALLSEDRVRAQVHHLWYEDENPERARTTEAGHVDLKMLRSLPTPEAQRAAVLEACARVAQLDGRTADVEQLTEEVLSLRTEQALETPVVEEQRAAEVPVPAVSTHGVFLPGVAVSAGRESPQPQPSAEPAAAVSTHGVYLPGVKVEAKNIVTPSPQNTPASPAQAPPTPETSNDSGLGV